MIYIKPTRYQIRLILAFYLIFLLIFLRSQFQVSAQSKQQSTLKLTTNNNNAFQIQQGNANRIIFLLIDAAKYQYSHQFEVIQRLLHQKPENSFLKKCIASEPTMTTQKIQTLMTGSEVFSTSSILDSFFSNSVKTDNLIKQLEHAGKKSVAMGDDTWGKLFSFTREYPCTTTFDIWDWQTCDKIIYENLDKQISFSDNSLIIAHFLALDHIGHSTSSTSDPNFGVMKLRFSQYFEQIVQKLKPNDLLLITGDHGMRDDGNHGGSSSAQTQTFLFAHSPTKQIKQYINISQIYQPDITSTISTILDIPVPQNSIGLPIFKLVSSQKNINPAQIQNLIRSCETHFNEIIQFAAADCPRAHKETTFQSLRQLQQSCMKKLGKSDHNMVLICISLTALGLLCLISLWINQQNYSLTLVIAVFFGIIHSFSWYLIQNSSSYYAFVLILLTLTNMYNNIAQKIQLLLAIVLVSQIQPQKPGDYQQNILKNKIFSEILINQITQIIILLVCTLCMIKYIADANKNSSGKRSKIYFFIYLPIFTAFAIVLVKNLFLENINQIILPLNYIITTYFILYLVCYLLFRQSQDRKWEFSIMTFSILSIFGNRLYFFIFFLYHFMLKASKKERMLFGWALAEYTWWLFGNRYEYSSFDIKQSYVYSKSYNQFTNPLCLVINSILPYLMIGIYEFMQPKEEYKIQITQNDTQNQFQGKTNNQLAIKIEEDKKKMIFLTKIMVWLVFAGFNLVYNDGKILFTIVYVPMMMIQSGKFFLIAAFFIIKNSLF